MTPRAIAMHALMQVARRGSFPDLLLDIYFKEHPELDSRDRALATELVYGVIRWQGRLDWIIDQQVKISPDKIALPVRLVLRLAAYQLLFLDRIPPSAAVNEAVELIKTSQPPHVVRFVNGVLRTISRKVEMLKEAVSQGSMAERLAVRYSYPVWLVQRWLSELGDEETEAFCAASNEVPPTDIRVNTLKTTVEEMANAFAALGFKVKTGRLVPEALHLRSIRTGLASLSQYERGEFQVQDEASQLVAHLLQPQPGEKVLDGCAGMGAKSTHLAQLMENHGKITAVDNQGWKLIRLMENAQRLQISCIEPLESDLLKLEPTEKLGPFDRILLDAPCSGLGVLRRNPDIKWRIRPKDFRRLHLLQRQMLSRVAAFLRPGGVLVYATCTFSSEENQATIRTFLSEHSEFHLESARPYLPPACKGTVDHEGNMQTWPHRDGVDGFFAARLRRK
ncbi:MAG: 16S rRNA (cytosine(967)-C(5))-methyltransferase RsmB [Syntrophobacterales bacterium]|jgi:16S rRNA (cytosine967-C5)-methyltransferase